MRDMYYKKILGLAEAQVAVQAIIEEALKDPNRPISVAVADERGDVIILTRMDEARPFFNERALQKAYTSATARTDTRKFLQMRLNEEISGDWGTLEPAGTGRTFIPGGVAIIEPNGIIAYGAIGVSGRTADEDEALAFVGLKALQNFLWPPK